MASKRPKSTAAKRSYTIEKFRIQNEPQASSKRTRARFKPERLQEVNEVRKARACLRCSCLGLGCSNGAICTTCRDLVFHVHGKRTLAFSACIRTRLAEVGYFESYITTGSVREVLLTHSEVLISTPISLQFGSHVSWNLSALVTDVDKWLHDSSDCETSKVGTLSSPQFADLIVGSRLESVSSIFQRMIYALSLAYTIPAIPSENFLSAIELRQIGAPFGQEMLKSLDNQLKPQSLKKCSLNDIQTLFLLVFGTILAVGYLPPPCEEELISVVKTSNDQFEQAQFHLCQILAHYLVFLASRLKLSMTADAGQSLLQGAPERWHKQGKYQWTYDVEGCDFMTEQTLNDGHSSNEQQLDELGTTALVSDEKSWSSLKSLDQFQGQLLDDTRVTLPEGDRHYSSATSSWGRMNQKEDWYSLEDLLTHSLDNPSLWPTPPNEEWDVPSFENQEQASSIVIPDPNVSNLYRVSETNLGSGEGKTLLQDPHRFDEPQTLVGKGIDNSFPVESEAIPPTRTRGIPVERSFVFHGRRTSRYKRRRPIGHTPNDVSIMRRSGACIHCRILRLSCSPVSDSSVCSSCCRADFTRSDNLTEWSSVRVGCVKLSARAAVGATSTRRSNEVTPFSEQQKALACGYDECIESYPTLGLFHYGAACARRSLFEPDGPDLLV